MPVSSSTEHWIRPDALKINLNHFGDPDYLQVSLLAGAVVMAFKQDVISYNAAHNYRTWPLQAANTYLETSSAYHVYARLTRSEVNASALVVYDPVLRDIEGREITISENGNEILDESSADYFFVYLGKISGSLDSNGHQIQRYWDIDFRFGTLDTNQYQNEESLGEWSKMFRLNKITDMIDVLKTFSLAVFKKIFIKDKEIIDIKRSSDSGLDDSDDIIPTSKYVKEETERKFLRKDQDDTTSHSLGVGKNLSVGGNASVQGLVSSGQGFQAGKFMSGLLGSGANIDAEGRAELHSLFVRQFLEVPELRYNRVTTRMGDSITSSSSGIIESVTPNKDNNGEFLPNGTLKLKLESGELGTLEEGDLVMQIFADMENPSNNADETSDDGKGNRTMKGFATVFFRVNAVSGEKREIIEYSLRTDTSWTHRVHPFAMGSYAQRGNDLDKPERQVVIYEGLYPKPYTRYMTGVNTWEFDSSMIKLQFGYLGNFTKDGQSFEGYSAYLDNVYFTGVLRQLYIPSWVSGESSSQNGTIVYMGGDHYVSKGDTDNPPLFDMLDENGNSLLFFDDNKEGSLLDENNEEYDKLAKKGDDGVGIKSTILYYQITETSEKPSETSEYWGTSFVQPTDLNPYLWKKTVITYTNLTKNITIECLSVRGKDGTSVNIKGSFDTEAQLIAKYPNGGDNPSDAYIVGGDLYVWTGKKWKNVGSIKGEKGDTAYIHIKYANETASGTQVSVNGTLVTLSFTTGDGEDMGDWLGIYHDFEPADSKNVADYKWQKTKGDKGVDSTSYWLDSPVGSVNFGSDGYPNPSSFVVTMRKKTGSGDVVACADFYLAAWRYSGSWELVTSNPKKTSTLSIVPAESSVYKQYRVTAHTTSSVSESNIVCQIGIGVSFDGMKGDTGADGTFVYDCGLYESGREYYYQEIDGQVRRDKIVYEIGGTFYNFLVRSRQTEGSRGITEAPTSASGDGNWEVMSQFRTIIANTLFGTNANIGGFMTSNETMVSQTKTNGEANIYMNGKTGEFRCTNAFVRGQIEATSGSIEGELSVGSDFKIVGNSDVSQGIYYNVSDSKKDSYGQWKFKPRGFMVVPRDSLQVENDAQVNCLMYLERARDNRFDRVFYAKGISEFNGRVAISSYNAQNTTASYDKPALVVEGGVAIYGGLNLNVRSITSNGSTSVDDGVIIFNNTKDITFTFDDSCPVGRVIYLKRATNYKVYLYGNLRASNSTSGGAVSREELGAYSMMYIKTDSYWTGFYCG